MAVEITRPGKAPLSVILDTSPLITLCAFSVRGNPVLEHLLALVHIRVVETVAQEGTANSAYPDAAVIGALLRSGLIERVPVPKTKDDTLIDGYIRLGKGECDTIRLGIISTESYLMLDDHLAFVVAARFDLRPILLLGLLVMLVQKHGLSKTLATEIIEQIDSRYSGPFVEHTRQKLEGEFR